MQDAFDSYCASSSWSQTDRWRNSVRGEFTSIDNIASNSVSICTTRLSTAAATFTNTSTVKVNHFLLLHQFSLRAHFQVSININKYIIESEARTVRRFANVHVFS